MRSSQSDEPPYLSLMAFAASDDLQQPFVVTKRETRKSANLADSVRTAVLVDNGLTAAADLTDAAAATAGGRAEELQGQARSDAMDLFLHKHSHLAGLATSTTSVLVQVRVQAYCVVS